MKDKVLILILLCLIGVTTPIVVKKFRKPSALPDTVTVDTGVSNAVEVKDVWNEEWEKSRD